MENRNPHELNDNELENISGGFSVGDVVRVRATGCNSFLFPEYPHADHINQPIL